MDCSVLNKKCWLCGGELSETVVIKLVTSITELGLSARAKNCLFHSGIKNLEQLLKLTEKDLLRLRNMGVRTLADIKEKIKAFGFGEWLK